MDAFTRFIRLAIDYRGCYTGYSKALSPLRGL